MSSPVTSSSLSSYSDVIPTPIKKVPKRKVQAIGLKHLERIDCSIRIATCIALLAIVATLATLGLIQAQYLPPLVPLYTFAVFAISTIVVCILDSYQQKVANRYGIDRQMYLRAREKDDSVLDMILPKWCCPRKMAKPSSLLPEQKKNSDKKEIKKS